MKNKVKIALVIAVRLRFWICWPEGSINFWRREKKKITNKKKGITEKSDLSSSNFPCFGWKVERRQGGVSKS